MGEHFVHVDWTERRLIKNMVKAGVTWENVQSITGRTPDSISSIVDGSMSKRKGAPIKFSASDVKKVVRMAEAMVKKANASCEVTLHMILAEAGYDVDAKTARKYFRKLKSQKTNATTACADNAP